MMERFALKICAKAKIPLSLRRWVAAQCVPMDGRNFSIVLDGGEYRGVLDNYIEWIIFVTRAYFEYTYLNLLRSIVSGGAALDVGANVGNHSHAFSAFFDEVHAF